MAGVLRKLGTHFAILGILFIPFPFNLFPFQANVTKFFLENLIRWISNNFFNKQFQICDFSSDTFCLFVLVGVLIGIALLSSILSMAFKLIKLPNTELLFNAIINYYIALMLLKYGFDKVFKAQFYLPEPNILFTPFGNLSKDILYWSVMGTSYWYSFFAGVLEIIAVILLLFSRTRILGLLLALAIISNVLAINFGFNITVKLFSTFLLFLIVLQTGPHLRSLFQYFVLKRNNQLKPEKSFLVLFPFWRVFLKSFVIGVFLLEALVPHLRASNFNDDLAERPFLHGAYQCLVSDTANHRFPIFVNCKRFFVHRDGYLIFQYADDKFQDYKMRINPYNNQLTLYDYQRNYLKLNYSYSIMDSLLTLTFHHRSDSDQLVGKTIPWRKMEALKN